jgi:DHA1 family bicyclomycin/chloramphenicol resistance-like MFS transporter
MRRLRPHSIGFILLLGALVTLASFATDMGLPVLGATAASLGVPAAKASYTISIFIFGFAIGPLLLGPLSDRFGRRPFLLGGVTAFTVFGAAGAFARSLDVLLLCRLLMGIGAGTAQVLVMATVRDLFAGSEARTRQSYINLAGGVAPIIAPTLGVAVAGLGGWRAIYAALASGGLVLLALATWQLRETAPLREPGTFTLRGSLRDYGRVIRHPVSIGNAVVVALGFGCLFAYVSSSSLVVIGLMGASQRVYGALFACTAFGLMVGSFSNARLTRRGVSHERLVTTGLTTIVITTTTLVLLTLAGLLTVWPMIALIATGNIAHGIVRPNTAQGALEPMPEIVGVASALLGGLQMIVGATASAVAAALFNGRSAIAMAGTMLFCATGAWLVYLFIARPAERRLHAGQEAAEGRPLEDVGATAAA